MVQERKFKFSQVKIFFDQLSREGRKLDIHEQTAFDPIASDLMAYLLNNAFSKGKGTTVSVSTYFLSRYLHTTRKRIRRRLKLLAKFGILKCVSQWRQDGTNKRKPLEITLNEYLTHTLRAGAKPAERLAAVKHFIGLGLARMECEEEIQGFEVDTEFGKEEPQPDFSTPTRTTAEKLDELIASEDQEKANKIKEARLWRERDAAFISSSARIWVFGQAGSGRGTAKPHWEGEISSLAPTARRERLELTKIFQQYGGRIAALSWYVFACGVPALDAKGNPIFCADIPHRQYASIDKKPSTFAKHFNAILKDPFFIDFAKKGWLKTEAALRDYYETSLDVRPKTGATDYQLVGFEFGEKTIALSEVTA